MDSFSSLIINFFVFLHWLIGVVLGRQGGMIKSMFLPFFLGLGGPIGTGKQPLPWIHLKDLCNLFLFAIENDKVSGVLNGVAPQVNYVLSSNTL